MLAPMLNVPNMLTIGRIIVILPFAWLYFHGSEAARWAALAVFALAAITDWLDGYLARRLRQGSEFGRMLDPIADKLLVATALVALVATGVAAGWGLVPVIAILLREIAVSGFREHLGQKGVVVAVTQLAKWKTTVQLVALALLLAPIEAAQSVGVWFLWIAAALTLVTGWGYLRAAVRA